MKLVTYLVLALGNSESISFSQQQFVIVTMWLIPNYQTTRLTVSSFICDIISNISATKANTFLLPYFFTIVRLLVATLLGFPLQKAVEYTKMHQPFLINDVEAQFALQDRPTVYKILRENNIETPRYAVCDRNASKGKRSVPHYPYFAPGCELWNNIFHLDRSSAHTGDGRDFIVCDFGFLSLQPV